MLRVLPLKSPLSEEIMNILLVEDSSADAYLFKGVMAQNAGSPDVQWVNDGQCALDYVLRKNQYSHAVKPDIILLDLNMPRVSGFELLNRLKADPALSTIPVIILTTSRDPYDHTRCRNLGADMCLSKPAALKDYEDMVSRIMDWVLLRHNAADSPLPAN
jgi:two-component system, chemotaxis family, response regulator Rcp1